MNANSVETVRDFVYFIQALVEEESFKGSLEEYLRVLWAVLSAKKDTKPSWAFFANNFHEAFFVPAPDFDESWMAYEQPPSLDATSPRDDFTLLERMLLYQIADLRRIKNSQLIEKTGQFAFLGLISPTKNNWYNFSVDSFLESATSGLNLNENNCSWLALAVFLWLGQIYE